MTATEVVLGMGGCVDVEITWDTAVFQDLVTEYAMTLGDADPEIEIRDERDLVASILGYLRAGRGGERYVDSRFIVERFAGRFDHRIALGGTAVRAGMAMAALGRPSTLHLVSIDDTVRRRLPAECQVISSAGEDSFDPHLIVQFPAGLRVRCTNGEIVAGRGNRLIYVNDRPNQELRLSSGLGAALSQARVLLMSGFNAVQDGAMLQDRLTELRVACRQLPAGALVIHEDAEYHQSAAKAIVRSGLAGLVDIHSMNEDELQTYVGSDVDLLDAADVLSAVRRLREVIDAPTVVVHSRHWALAAGRDAARLAPALQGGVTMASTRFRCGDTFSVDDYRGTAALPPDLAAAQVAAELSGRSEVTCVPVPDMAVSTPTLVGLGDTFIGGFIAALVPDGSPSPAPAAGSDPELSTSAGHPGSLG